MSIRVEKTKRKYPYMAVFRNRGNVVRTVWFVSPGKGIAICDEPCDEFNKVISTWCEDAYEPLEGKIIILP